MSKRFHKTALSITTALLTLTSAVTTVNGAQRNQITIESDKSELNGGETFNVAVGYIPDADGASGFTIDLHYDVNAVNLNIPDDGSYTVDSAFSLVTNFTADEGVVRIVGANLTGANVTESTAIANLSFTAKDGFSGSANFWTTVDTLVSTDGDDFVNVDFTSFGEYSPYSVTVAQTADEDSQVDDTAQDDSSEEISDSYETETTVESTADSQDDSVLDSQADEQPEQADTASLPDEIIPEEITQTADDGTAIFSHTQGDTDYNNEEALQYTFSPYDYITDVSQPVDITIGVSCDGSAQGGIGMLTSDGWTISGGSAQGGEDVVWTAQNVDLSDVTGDIAVQLYYLKNNSEFKITSISIAPSGEQTTEISAAAEETDDETSDDSDISTAADVQESDETPEESAQAEETEESYDEYTEAEDESDVESAEAVESDEYTEVPEESAAQDTADAEADEESVGEDSGEAQTYTVGSGEAATVQTSGTDSQEEIESAVSQASQKADASPDTGSSAGLYICGGIMILCSAQIIYSAYSLLSKREDKKK